VTSEEQIFRRRLWAGSGLFLLTLGIRLLPAWLLKHEVADMQTYRTVANAVGHGDNVYAFPITFPYVPYSQFIPAWLLAVAERTGWSFDFVMKIPMILTDACTTLLIFGYLQWRALPFRLSVGWALAWALNPVSILISAFHGNLMSIVPFLALAAYVSAEVGETSRNRDLLLLVSGLLLGLAIAMRTYPVLLVPVFLLLFCRTVSETAAFIFVAAVPAGLSSLPYLFLARETFLREVLGYGGLTDFGWVSVLRAMAFIAGGHRVLSVDPVLLSRTKELFLGAYLLVCLTMPFFSRSALGRALMIAPLLFYALYGGVSAQYLVWVLPFAVLLRQRLTFPFTGAATAALVAFYSIYHPGILTGHSPSPITGDELWVWVMYVAANVLLVFLSLTWVMLIVGAELRSYLQTRRQAPVPWLQGAQWLWSSRSYAVILLLFFAGWLTIAYSAGHRAREVARVILP